MMSAFEKTIIPFTHAQRLVWLGQRLNPGVPLYNMALRYDLGGDLDLKKFQSAWDALVSECDLLRCALHDDAKAPGLVLGAPAQLTIDERASAQTRKAFVTDAFAPEDPLTRLMLMRNEHGDWCWTLVQHHLVTDLASFFVLFRRLGELYADPGAAPTLVDFAKYVKREAAARETPGVVDVREGIKHGTPELEPAVDFYARTAHIHAWRNTRRDLEFNRSGLVRSGEAGFGQDLKDNFSLLTALAVLLYRQRARDAVVIGVPLHNRTNRSRQNTPGMLVEIVPLRIELDGADTLDDVRNRIGASFARLMRAGTTGLLDDQLAGRFDVVLNYLQVPALEFDARAVSVDWVHCDSADPAHALRVHVWREADDSASRIIFDTRDDTFDDSRADSLMSQFSNVIAQVNEDPSVAVNAVSMWDESSRDRFDSRSVGAIVSREFAGGLVSSMQNGAQIHGASTALRDARTTVDYQNLLDQVRARAGALQAAGVGPNVPVVVWRWRSIDAVIDLLAVMFAGGCFVPVEASTPRERVRQIVEDLGAYSSQVFACTEGAARDDAIAFGARPIDTKTGANEWTAHEPDPGDLCYVLYTSGSTGTPKGVSITHASIHDYICWAKQVYEVAPTDRFGLFTSLGFDLTMTSVFLPLVTGASLRVYPTQEGGTDLAITDVVAENDISFAKLTPSHLAFWDEDALEKSSIRCWVLGGEQFTVEQANRISRAQPEARIFNEYGPTEATVACMLHRFSSADIDAVAVPIGRPADNHSIYLLDEAGHPVANEVAGEIYIGGAGLADGYLNRERETGERFVHVPGIASRLYRTGDIARWNTRDQLEYIGRRDRQVKLSGVRFELAELDNLLLKAQGVDQAVSVLTHANRRADPGRHCVECGLPDNYPQVEFSEDGLCSVCDRFHDVQDDVMTWFRTSAELEALVSNIQQSKAPGENNCAVLFSGGKDSTYMVYQLVRMGLRPVALSLDNGYLSDGAHQNIQKVVQDLGIDHVYLGSKDMNRIFADSLKQFSNVCNGCFKTIYSLSMQWADASGIGWIFTGLSRGQLFETRIDDLFNRPQIPVSQYDDLILQARKAYHRMDDVVGRCLGNGYFDDDDCFTRVQFEDFYRYVDVPLDEVYEFLGNSAPWVRPSDTGRSTNCLINDAGIYVHRQVQGYHNYALPYAWDVRLGHKTREQAIDELRDRIDSSDVERLLKEVGFTHSVANTRRLALWVSNADGSLTKAGLREWLAQHLPGNLLPETIEIRRAMPLTANGKIDTDELVSELEAPVSAQASPPETDDERFLANAWGEALGRNLSFSRNDNFFGQGGDSMAAILLVDGIRTAGRTLSLGDVFNHPELRQMALRLDGDSGPIAHEDDIDFGLSLDADDLDALNQSGH